MNFFIGLDPFERLRKFLLAMSEAAGGGVRMLSSYSDAFWGGRGRGNERGVFLASNRGKKKIWRREAESNRR